MVRFDFGFRAFSLAVILTATALAQAQVLTVQEQHQAPFHRFFAQIGLPTAFWKPASGPNCPSSGFRLANTCWYLGNTSQTCDNLCSGISMIYDPLTGTYAGGSGGTDANCAAVLDGLAIGSGLPTTQATNRGCQYRPSDLTRYRGTNATTSGSSNANFRRACACMPSDSTPDVVNWADFNDSSSVQTISGINVSVNLEITGIHQSGSPDLYYRINAGSWVAFNAGSGQSISGINSGDTLEFKVVSATIGSSTAFTLRNLSDSNAILDTFTGTVATAADVTPDAINWADFTDFSSTQHIAGIDIPITLEISAVYGTGTPELGYKVNGGSKVTFTPGSPATFQVNVGDYVQLTIFSITASQTATFTIKNLSDGGVTLDTAVGTTTAGCGGYATAGACFYLGAAVEHCDTVCTGRGGCDLTATRTVGENSTNCLNTLAGLGITANSSSSSFIYGCAYSGSTRRFGSSGTVTCAAVPAAGYARACGCTWAGTPPLPRFDIDGYTYRFNESGLAQSCNTVCTNYGGCVLAGLTHANSSVTKCRQILSGFGKNPGNQGLFSDGAGCTWGSATNAYQTDTSAPTCAGTRASAARVCSCAN